ncbi:hypothetical protein RSAG8_09849, partial [Rhizoctonia solani AG-8 WAC10335]
MPRILYSRLAPHRSQKEGWLRLFIWNWGWTTVPRTLGCLFSSPPFCRWSALAVCPLSSVSKSKRYTGLVSYFACRALIHSTFATPFSARTNQNTLRLEPKPPIYSTHFIAPDFILDVVPLTCRPLP